MLQISIKEEVEQSQNPSWAADGTLWLAAGIAINNKRAWFDEILSMNHRIYLYLSSEIGDFSSDHL